MLGSVIHAAKFRSRVPDRFVTKRKCSAAIMSARPRCALGRTIDGTPFESPTNAKQSYFWSASIHSARIDCTPDACIGIGGIGNRDPV
jgi:hypothetical protein